MNLTPNPPPLNVILKKAVDFGRVGTAEVVETNPVTDLTLNEPEIIM